MTQELTNNRRTLPEITSVRSLVEIRKTQRRYRDYETAARQTWLTGQITTCNLINHSPKTDADIIKMDAATLDGGIMQDRILADLTLPEISFAMLHGTLGEYGEFYGLTARAFLVFLREFLKTDIKEWATHEERKAIAPPERGTWALQRMEHNRKQVQAEWDAQQERDELDERLEGWKKQITNQTPKQ